MRGPTLIAGAVAVLSLSPRPASANCARPSGYDVTVRGNTVTICPESFQDRTCPDPSGMLRQEVGSGATVRIADSCDSSCYVDECVPPGHYRYGFARPYACCTSCCSTEYYAEAAVAMPVAGDCKRRGVAPTPYQAPWGSRSTVCTYGALGCGCDLGGRQAASTVLGIDALVAALAGLLLVLRSRRRRYR